LTLDAAAGDNRRLRAIQLISTGAPLEERELPLPVPGEGEVLIEVQAAGICHSDVHYRAGSPSPKVLPRTLGHEVAGVIEDVGPGVDEDLMPGTPVAVNYVLHCGRCTPCRNGRENHCTSVGMLGSSRDGGYAEYIVVPARNALPIPAELPFDQAAIMMCSTATAYHALRLAAVTRGEAVCVLGFGGLGVSAVQLAGLLEAGHVFVVDRVPAKLEAAAGFGAQAVPAQGDLTQALHAATNGRGVDVVLDFVGHGATTRAALDALAHGGRLVSVALSSEPFTLDPYRDLIGRERSVLGSNDHLTSELRDLIAYAARGALDLGAAITRTLPLEAAAINPVLDEIAAHTAHFRSVIVPERA
jgi:D-arabinose 1-dehydrogenase-like Zn-dependent alcohol dehydrogenase